MNKKLLISLFAIALTASLKAQFTSVHIEFWVGSGADTTMLVVDFKDGTQDSSYAWGYLHNGMATGEDLLKAIDSVDPNFTAVFSGGFLSDVYYNQHEGVGGVPDYWATWDGADLASLTSNAGLSANLINGGWFGLSYTDFSPALEPGEPIAAFHPEAFTLSDATYFVGSGSDTALLIIDFFDLSQPSSFAWGYLFNDSTTGQEMLQDISDADTLLQVDMNGFLNDITYQSLSGIGGSPNYWGTWSATNYGNWEMNAGISTAVKPGDFFGTSYMDFTEYSRPEVPAAAVNTIGLKEQTEIHALKVYPQPASQKIFVELPETTGDTEISIFSLSGKKLISLSQASLINELDVSNLPAGVYILQYASFSKKILIQ